MAEIIELTEQTRARWLWLLAAVTAAYGFLNLLVFYTTGSFGPIWFAAGALVYSLLLVSALALSIADTGRSAQPVEPAREPQADTVEASSAEPSRTPVELIDHEAIYKTRTGRLLYTRFRANGTERRLLFAVTDDEVTPIGEVERRVDDFDLEPRPIEDLRALEDALERRASKPPASLDPEDVHVEILDHEPLYEADRGRVLRARYRVNGDEHVSLFAATDEGIEPVDALEERLDGIEVDELAVEPETVYEEALAGDEPGDQAPSEQPPDEVIRR